MESREIIDAVQRIQDYIEAHITEPISLRDIARAAGYSPWHAERVFKDAVGITPFEYIRRRRLSKAALDLQHGNSRIVDVALDYVFSSHEGFTRAFSREFGVSPAAYRKRRPEIRLFMPPEIKNYYQKLVKGEIQMTEATKAYPVFTQVVDRPARKFILKRGIKAEDYFAYCEELGCDVYADLAKIKEALYEPIGAWLPDKFIKPGTSKYVQGVEMPADYKGPVPDGMEIIDLPPCKIMVFQGPAYDDNDFMEAIGQLWDVMKTFKPETYGFKWADDDGPRFQLEPRGYRGYIEARPVRPVNQGK